MGVDGLESSLKTRLNRAVTEYMGLSLLYVINYKDIRTSMELCYDLSKYRRVDTILADALLLNRDNKTDAERILAGERGNAIIRKIFSRNGLTEGDLSYEILEKYADQFEKTADKFFGGGNPDKILRNLERLCPESYESILRVINEGLKKKLATKKRGSPDN